MTITVTPDPLAEPPVNDLTLSVPGSSIMTALQVWRNDPDGSRTDLREQPVAGFNSRPASDPECPYEVEVTYGWTVTYFDPAGFSTVFDETWASTAAWTVLSGSFNVSGGKLRNNAAGTGQIYRSVASGKYRVTVASLTEAAASGAGAWLRFLSGGTTVMQLEIDTAGVVILRVNGSPIPTTIDGTQPIVVDMGATSWSVIGTGGSYTVLTSLGISTLLFTYSSAAGANEWLLGGVKVQSYPAPTTVTETSDPVTLDVHDTWLVHPAAPGKSFKLQNVEPLEAGIRTFGDLTRPARANLVDILGSDWPVPVTTGPRGGPQLSVTIATLTGAELAALNAVLADEVPLLVQVPPSWDDEFECGFYAFGTSVERRRVSYLSRPHPWRLWDIPLVRVASPIVDVQNSGWSVGAVLAEFATVADVLATFDTTADLLVNNRS